jgi:hypothetical protein
MCKKQELIHELCNAAVALIEKYNSVIQDREWVAMQAVSRASGFAYRGPWIAKEVQDLATLVEAAKMSEKNQCHDKSTDTHFEVSAKDGI